MVKPIDITRTVIVPKPAPYQEKIKSFFIGHVDSEVIETMTEVEAEVSDQIKQPHLDNSKIKDTEWKDLY
jgi:hypothetical protein|tara:strand:- start:920 stop:1129 length:210 start_codon:yes stop_codon:yes gene_type:complete